MRLFREGSLACVVLGCAMVGCGGVAATGPVGGSPSDAGPTNTVESGAPTPIPPVGQDAGATGDGGATTPADASAPFAAAHSALPIVTDQGGPILANPHLVTITYAGFALDPDVHAFGDFVVASSWLTTVGAEYGVGAGTHTHVVLSDSAPATTTSADTVAYLSQKIADGTLPGGVQTEPTNDVYMILYPPSTVVTDLDTASQCSSSAGSTFKLGAIDHDGTGAGQRIAWAIVTTCPSEEAIGVDWSTAELLVAAATDPYRLSQPAYLLDSSNPWFPWENQVAYMCDFMPPVVESGYSLPPIWSNAQAAAGTWPCVPAPSGPYFNTSVAPDVTQSVAAGKSITIPVTGWSTAAVPDWTVTAQAIGNGFTPTASFGASASTNAMNNGTTATLTVSVPAGTPSGSLGVVNLGSARNDGFWLSQWIVPFQVP